MQIKSKVSILAALLIVSAIPAQAAMFPIKIFTNDGDYSGSSDINLFLEVLEGDTGQVEFTFHNDSLVNSSIASVYFESDYLSGINDIVNGSGTSFHQFATPHNLPAGRSLDSPFETTEGFSAKADSPPPFNGINPGESIKIIFDLKPSVVFAQIVSDIETGDMRVGVHLIALPDGSSESAVTTPEPATIIALTVGSLVALYKRRK